jgi:hypothetical protein
MMDETITKQQRKFWANIIASSEIQTRDIIV